MATVRGRWTLFGELLRASNERGRNLGHLFLSAAEAGEYYNLRIPIAAEAQSGKTWADVH